LLDLKPNKSDGREVLKQIKLDSALQPIPVIVFTESTSEKKIDLAYELGANCVIAKPANIAEFIDLVGLTASFWTGYVTLPRNSGRAKV
jgi:CheY-like chemotaxis protein